MRCEAAVSVAALPSTTTAPPAISDLRSRLWLTELATRSKDGRLGVVAEHLLQRLDDLALRGVRARARQQRLHQVALDLRRVLAQRRQRGLDGRAVALGARALQ